MKRFFCVLLRAHKVKAEYDNNKTKAILSDFLMKKFINPNSYLGDLKPANTSQDLLYSRIKLRSFSTYIPSLFWGKNKNKGSNRHIPSLPIVHDKTDGVQEPNTSQQGWAGQLVNTPISHPRPESENDYFTGSVRSMKKKKKKVLFYKSKMPSDVVWATDILEVSSIQEPSTSRRGWAGQLVNTPISDPRPENKHDDFFIGSDSSTKKKKKKEVLLYRRKMSSDVGVWNIDIVEVNTPYSLLQEGGSLCSVERGKQSICSKHVLFPADCVTHLKTENNLLRKLYLLLNVILNIEGKSTLFKLDPLIQNMDKSNNGVQFRSENEHQHIAKAKQNYGADFPCKVFKETIVEKYANIKLEVKHDQTLIPIVNKTTSSNQTTNKNVNVGNEINKYAIRQNKASHLFENECDKGSNDEKCKTTCHQNSQHNLRLVSNSECKISQIRKYTIKTLCNKENDQFKNEIESTYGKELKESNKMIGINDYVSEQDYQLKMQAAKQENWCQESIKPVAVYNKLFLAEPEKHVDVSGSENMLKTENTNEELECNNKRSNNYKRENVKTTFENTLVDNVYFKLDKHHDNYSDTSNKLNVTFQEDLEHRTSTDIHVPIETKSNDKVENNMNWSPSRNSLEKCENITETESTQTLIPKLNDTQPSTLTTSDKYESSNCGQLINSDNTKSKGEATNLDNTTMDNNKNGSLNIRKNKHVKGLNIITDKNKKLICCSLSDNLTEVKDVNFNPFYGLKNKETKQCITIENHMTNAPSPRHEYKKSSSKSNLTQKGIHCNDQTQFKSEHKLKSNAYFEYKSKKPGPKKTRIINYSNKLPKYINSVLLPHKNQTINVDHSCSQKNLKSLQETRMVTECSPNRMDISAVNGPDLLNNVEMEDKCNANSIKRGENIEYKNSDFFENTKLSDKELKFKMRTDTMKFKSCSIENVTSPCNTTVDHNNNIESIGKQHLNNKHEKVSKEDSLGIRMSADDVDKYHSNTAKGNHSHGTEDSVLNIHPNKEEKTEQEEFKFKDCNQTKHEKKKVEYISKKQRKKRLLDSNRHNKIKSIILKKSESFPMGLCTGKTNINVHTQMESRYKRRSTACTGTKDEIKKIIPVSKADKSRSLSRMGTYKRELKTVENDIHERKKVNLFKTKKRSTSSSIPSQSSLNILNFNRKPLARKENIEEELKKKFVFFRSNTLSTPSIKSKYTDRRIYFKNNMESQSKSNFPSQINEKNNLNQLHISNKIETNCIHEKRNINSFIKSESLMDNTIKQSKSSRRSASVMRIKNDNVLPKKFRINLHPRQNLKQSKSNLILKMFNIERQSSGNSNKIKEIHLYSPSNTSSGNVMRIQNNNVHPRPKLKLTISDNIIRPRESYLSGISHKIKETNANPSCKPPNIDLDNKNNKNHQFVKGLEKKSTLSCFNLNKKYSNPKDNETVKGNDHAFRKKSEYNMQFREINLKKKLAIRSVNQNLSEVNVQNPNSSALITNQNNKNISKLKTGIATTDSENYMLKVKQSKFQTSPKTSQVTPNKQVTNSLQKEIREILEHRENKAVNKMTELNPKYGTLISENIFNKSKLGNLIHKIEQNKTKPIKKLVNESFSLNNYEDKPMKQTFTTNHKLIENMGTTLKKGSNKSFIMISETNLNDTNNIKKSLKETKRTNIDKKITNKNTGNHTYMRSYSNKE